MGPPDMFGELSVFDDGPRTASATTLTEVRAVSLDRDTLRGWMADRPEVAEQLLRVLARRLRRTNTKLTDQIFTDVPGRVAKQLLQLAQQFGTREGDALRVAHDLTQEEIAQLVGAGREATNQRARHFRRPWLDPVGKPQPADPRRRKPCAPSTLTGPCRPPSWSPAAAADLPQGAHGRQRALQIGPQLSLLVDRTPNARVHERHPDHQPTAAIEEIDHVGL